MPKPWSESGISEQRRHFLALRNKGCGRIGSYPGVGRAAGEATTLGTRPISAHVKQMEKILRDVKGIGRIKSGGLVHKDKFAHNE